VDTDPTFHFDADPEPACHFDADPDLTFHFNADPNPDPRFLTKAQNLEKVLKWSRIPYILACHLQIDPVPDPAYHLDADPDPTFQFDADPDLDGQHWHPELECTIWVFVYI
jgi:hypothetical protein